MIRRHDIPAKWVDIRGAGDFLGYSPGTLRNMLCQGEDIPHSRKRGRLRFYLPDLHAWMRRAEEQPVERRAQSAQCARRGAKGKNGGGIFD